MGCFWKIACFHIAPTSPDTVSWYNLSNQWYKDGLRGGKDTFKEALDKAFEKTGTPKEDFEVTKWGKDQYGKSHPVESGAPTADHVGWQTGRKRGSGGGVRGHIFVDEVPYNR